MRHVTFSFLALVLAGFLWLLISGDTAAAAPVIVVGAVPLVALALAWFLSRVLRCWSYDRNRLPRRWEKAIDHSVAAVGLHVVPRIGDHVAAVMRERDERMTRTIAAAFGPALAKAGIDLDAAALGDAPDAGKRRKRTVRR